MKRRFTFGQYDLSEFLHVESIERPPLQVKNHFAESDEREEIFLYNNTCGKDIVVKARYIAPYGKDKNCDLFASTGITAKNGKKVSLAEMLYTNKPQKLYLDDRDEEGHIYDLCVVDGEVTREDFAYTSLYTIRFHSAYDCSFGEEIECEILNGETVTNYGNKEVFPYMEFTTKGGEVKIWNSANKDTFVFTHPQSDYQISVDNEKLTTHMTGTDVGMDRHLSLTSRWQHLPPGETHIFFSGIDKLRVVLVPRYIG